MLQNQQQSFRNREVIHPVGGIFEQGLNKCMAENQIALVVYA
jgi:hypothetical protein